MSKQTCRGADALTSKAGCSSWTPGRTCLKRDASEQGLRQITRGQSELYLRQHTVWNHQIAYSTCFNTAAATKAKRKPRLESLEKHNYECRESKVEKYRKS
ncbi:hypothetical protein F2P81_008056 [Scophthalmus maximus]|uniref:Uncharacterized protein n=1 Tax=Scophthalmus maximus TaxID=52904 RepID=A0A6A4TA23_SCOMX|nr:hypothetical protein F2P81_008056 [Scophthalmus maximus]